MSTDGGTSYQLIGSLFGQSIMGTVLTSTFPATADPDSSDTLHLDLTESAGTLADFTTAQRDLFIPSCYIENGGTVTINGKTVTVPYELISYATANLITGFHYDIVPTTRRGVYNTPVASHVVGKKFLYLGPGARVFEYVLNPSLIGTTLKFKFPAFNQFGKLPQDITTCTAYSFTPTGLSQGANTWNYTISPNPVLYQGQSGGYPAYPSFTDPTKLYILPFTATWSDGVTANYTPTSPSAIPGSAPETLYVTIYDPGRTGSGTMYIETSTTKSTTPGYVFLGSIHIQSTSTGGSTGGSGGGNVGNNPFDIAFYFNGMPDMSFEILRIPIDKQIVLPSGLINSQAVCETAPTGSVSLTIKRTTTAGVTTTIGTIDFAGGAKVATFTFSADVTVLAGEILTIVAPNPQDATFATVGGMLSATR